MKTSSAISKALSLLALLALFVAFSPAVASAEGDAGEPYYFVDLLYLEDGKGVADAEDYFRRMAPIAARHGLKRVDSYSVTKTLQGDEPANLVNVWWVAGPETFGGISNDPDYKRLTSVRDAVFDMGRSLAFNARVTR